MGVFLINKAKLFSQKVMLTLLKYSGEYSVETLVFRAMNTEDTLGLRDSEGCYLFPGFILCNNFFRSREQHL